MQFKLRSRTTQVQRSTATSKKFIPLGVNRSTEFPLISALLPTSTPTETFGPTRTMRPTRTATPTPTKTPVPTPTPIQFNYDAYFAGPGESEELILYSFNEDIIYVKTPTTAATTSTYRMNIHINDEYVNTVEYNSNRANMEFAYKRSTAPLGPHPEFIGIFPNVDPMENPLGGDVFFYIAVDPTSTPTPTPTLTPTV